MKKKLLSIILVLCMTLSIGVTSFAADGGINTGNENNTGGDTVQNSSGGPSAWDHQQTIEWVGGSGAGSVSHQYLIDLCNNGTIKKMRLINDDGSPKTTVTYNFPSWCKSWAYLRWNFLDGSSGWFCWELATSYVSSNIGFQPSPVGTYGNDLPDSQLLDYISSPKGGSQPHNGFYHSHKYTSHDGVQVWPYIENGTGRLLDAVYLGEWEESYTTPNMSLIKITTDDGTELDRTGESAQSIYDNPTTSDTYHGKSLVDEMHHENTVTSKYRQVFRKTTYKTDGTRKWDFRYEYWFGPMQTQTKKIEYDVKTPALDQTWFRPYDLNRNGLAQETEVKSDYPDYTNGGTPLKMTVDNKQNIVDGTSLKTLDTNTSTPFNITLNDQLGLPKASEGGFDLEGDTTPGESYKITNGAGAGTYQPAVVSAMGGVTNECTGKLSWNASGGSSSGNSNVNGDVSKNHYWAGSIKGNLNDTGTSASLTYSGTEKVGNGEVWTFPKGWLGGDFMFKTIKVGDYKLANGGKNWWELNYEQGRWYRYGVEYDGTIVPGRISAPNKIGEAFYARLNSTQKTQPAVKGKFNAKTVAGNAG